MRRLSVTLVLAFGLTAGPTALAQNKAPTPAPAKRVKKKRRGKKTIFMPPPMPFNKCFENLKRNDPVKNIMTGEVSLQDLVEWAAELTCKPLLVDAVLPTPKIRVITPTAVTPAEVWRAFQAAINMLGMTVVDMGAFYKVVQIDVAIHREMPVYYGGDHKSIRQAGSVVTQILRIDSVDAGTLLPLVEKMRTRRGSTDAYKPTNSLIIADIGENVRRIVKVIKSLDRARPGQKIFTLELQHAAASQVKQILDKLFIKPQGVFVPDVEGQPGERIAVDPAAMVATKIIDSPDTRHLFILSTPAAFGAIVSLARKIDRKDIEIGQRAHVVYLAHRNADALANTLNGVVGGHSRAAIRPGKASAKGKLPFLQGQVKIMPDKKTNALVVVASLKDFLSIKALLSKLDIPRRQVFIDISILEIQLSSDRKLGVGGHSAHKVGENLTESVLFGAVQSPSLSSLTVNPLVLMGLAAGARGSPVEGGSSILGVDIAKFGVLFQALQNNSNVNVVSSPHILTTDNEEAEITVGQNIPFQTSLGGGLSQLGALAGAAGAAGAGGLGALASLGGVSVQRQDVALKIKVTPHVSDSGNVRLELSQEVSDIASANFNGLGPSTTKRTVKTTVVVHDQQAVVIGGLVGTTVRKETSAVPLLGEIPFLGRLFSFESSTKRRTNLMIVLTPYVIHSQADLRRIFRQKLADRREFIERYTTFTPRDEIGRGIEYKHKTGLLGKIHQVSTKLDREKRMRADFKRVLDAGAHREAVTPVETTLPATTK